jgi:hypothetical protein
MTDAADLDPTMNNQLFELGLAEQVVSQGADVEEVSRFLVWPPDSDRALDEALAAFEMDAFTYQFRIEKTILRAGGRVPWAILQFTRNYRLAGHLRDVRSSAYELAFTSLSIRPDHDVLIDGIPPVSTVFAYSKDALEHAARRSELLAEAWRLLSGKSAKGRYCCLADPTDVESVKRREIEDDDLFSSHLGRSTPSWCGWSK